MIRGLSNVKVACLVGDGFSPFELFGAQCFLENCGAQVKLISVSDSLVRPWQDGQWGDSLKVDHSFLDYCGEHFQALLIPGGSRIPKDSYKNPQLIEFVKTFFVPGHRKAVGAIYQGQSLLLEAGLLEGRKVTSSLQLRKPIEHAGAQWVDNAVVWDEELVTSQTAGALGLFLRTFVGEMSLQNLRFMEKESNFTDPSFLTSKLANF